MYSKIGFYITKNYGQYIDMPESACMEKILECKIEKPEIV